MLFGIFAISIDHRGLTVTTRYKCNSHCCLHISDWLLTQETGTDKYWYWSPLFRYVRHDIALCAIDGATLEISGKSTLPVLTLKISKPRGEGLWMCPQDGVKGQIP